MDAMFIGVSAYYLHVLNLISVKKVNYKFRNACLQ